MADKITLTTIVDELQSNPLGGEINFDASTFGSKTNTEESFNIHCWNGKRYTLTLTSMPDGVEYDAATGLAKE